MLTYSKGRNFAHILKGKNIWEKMDLWAELLTQGEETNQKEHEEENPAEPGGDKPRTVADTFHHWGNLFSNPVAPNFIQTALVFFSFAF